MELNILMPILLAMEFLTSCGELTTISPTPNSSLALRDLMDGTTDSWGTAADQVLFDETVNQRSSGNHNQTSPRAAMLREFQNFSLSPNSSMVGSATSSDKINSSYPNLVKAFVVQSSDRDSITLSCLLFDPSILTVSWYRHERLTTHDTLAPSADVRRMSVSYDINDSNRRIFNLTIDFPHSDDSGKYTCRGVNRQGAAASVNVTVTGVPEVNRPECYLNGKRRPIVTVGDELNFECRMRRNNSSWHLLWIRQLNNSVFVISTPVHERLDMMVSTHTVVAAGDLKGAIFMCSLLCLNECPNQPQSEQSSCHIGPLIINPRPPTKPPPIISIDPGIQIASEGDDLQFSCSTSLADGNAFWFPVGEEPQQDHVIVSGDGSQMAIKNVRDNDTDLMACGVFCQEKLITVRQANIHVLRPESTSTTRQATTSKATPTTMTSSVYSSTPTVVTTHAVRNNVGDVHKRFSATHSKNSILFGVPLALFIIITLTVVLVLVKCRKHSYHRTPTSEPQEIPVTV